MDTMSDNSHGRVAYKPCEFLRDSRGWWWHFEIYNYLTEERKVFNSKHPFETYEEALEDMKKFLEGK